MGKIMTGDGVRKSMVLHEEVKKDEIRIAFEGKLIGE